MSLMNNTIVLMIDCGEYYNRVEYKITHWRTDEKDNSLFFIDGKSEVSVTKVPKEDVKQEQLEFKNEESKNQDQSVTK